jgi:glycosyltransferase involved in cell wall biosynthesis
MKRLQNTTYITAVQRRFAFPWGCHDCSHRTLTLFDSKQIRTRTRISLAIMDSKSLVLYSPPQNSRLMTTIAVVHPNLMTRGGAENVCMHVLEALQTDHDLTLFTLTQPDIDALNRFFRTNVSPLEIRLAGTLGPGLSRTLDHRLSRLQAAFLGRYVHRHVEEYDLVFSTKNEFMLPAPSIQYIHSPQFAEADPGIDRINPTQRMYNRFCDRVAGPTEQTLRSSRYLANSEWTADAFAETYGVSAETVYPPVDGSKFPERSWTEREPGFLTIGRIGPSKHILENMDLVAELRARGHDVHLHVVGPTTDAEYSDQVEDEAEGREYVSVEGAVEHDELVELIAGHRYGLHGRPFEHFGIAVAELIAGGTIAFAPNSGGQREILNEDSRLLYDSSADAIEKIDRVLSEQPLQETLREDLRDTQTMFSRQQFVENVRGIVNEVIA